MSKDKFPEFMTAHEVKVHRDFEKGKYLISSMRKKGLWSFSWDDLQTFFKFVEKRHDWHRYEKFNQNEAWSLPCWNEEVADDDIVNLVFDIDKINKGDDYKINQDKKELLLIIKKKLDLEFTVDKCKELIWLDNPVSGNSRIYARGIMIKNKYRKCLTKDLNEDELQDFPFEIDENIQRLRTLFSFKRKKCEENLPDIEGGRYEVGMITKEERQSNPLLNHTLFTPTGTLGLNPLSKERWENMFPKKENTWEETEDNEDKPIKRTITDEQEELILEYCDPDSSWKIWKELIQAMFNLGISKEQIIKWCMKSKKWNEHSDLKTLEFYERGIGKRNIKYIYKWLKDNEKEDICEQLKDIRKQVRKKTSSKKSDLNLFNTDDDTAKTAFSLLEGKIKVHEEKGKSEYFAWNDIEKLWKVSTQRTVRRIVSNALINMANTIINNIEERQDEKESIEYLEQSLRKFKSTGGIRSIFELCIDLFTDLEFKAKLNPINDWLPLRGGNIYNMQTKELRERTHLDLYSRELTCNLTNDISEGIQYMIELFGESDWKRANKIFGYFWVPQNDGKKLFILIGEPDTGKSTMINFIHYNLGHRFKPLSKRVIVNTKNQSCHDEELKYAITGTTFTCASETSKEEDINEALVKKLTGNDATDVRGCGREMTDIENFAKIAIMTNNQPKVSLDQGLQNRLLYLNFPNHFERTNKNIKKIKLLSTNQKFLDSLFSLQMIGAFEYYTNSVIEDDVKTRNKYLKNSVEVWLEEETDKLNKDDPEYKKKKFYFRIPTQIAWDNFQTYIKGKDFNVVIKTKSDFIKQMEKYGYAERNVKFGPKITEKKIRSQTRCFCDLKINNEKSNQVEDESDDEE